VAWWRHDPAGIRHTLSATLTEAKGWAKDVHPMSGDVAGAGAAAASGVISAALEKFVESQATAMSGITSKTVSGINGAQKATGVYLETDKDQGDNARRANARSGGGHPR
jgi:hypothetical protein